MRLALEILVAALLVTGGSFLLVGSWGLARLPTLLTRLHGPTKATTLGVGACLIAAMIAWPAFVGRVSLHELLISLFLLLTAPVSASMIAKAHLHRQARKAGARPADVPAPPAGDWAVFRGAEEEGRRDDANA